MDLFEAIALRHSYRGEFAKTPVPREHLNRIVEAGIMAPSGCNNQTTHFAIVDDPQVKDAIRETMPTKPEVRTASAFIAVFSEIPGNTGGMSFEVQDYSAAVENMLLAITGLGYASVWLDGVLHSRNIAQRIADALGVKPNQGLVASVLLPVGVPMEKGRQNDRLPFEKRAWYNRG
jgi:nitroreductase